MLHLGIDVGGKTIKAGIVDEEGKILIKKSLLVSACCDSAKAFGKAIVSICFDLLNSLNIKKSKISYVGIGFPAAVSDLADAVPFLTNIEIESLPIRKLFEQYWDVPLVVGNDAVCAAWAEYLFGAGRGCKSFVAVTLGTGIGGGIIINGQPYLSANGVAGEVGHMVIAQGGSPCNCGRLGCWEQYASATALIRMTRQAMLDAPYSNLWEQCNGNIELIDAAMPFAAERSGDIVAHEVCECYRNSLADGLMNIMNILQPEIIALGGGVANEGDEFLLYPVRHLLQGRSLAARGLVRETKIVKAELGSGAGIIGAAFLEQLRRS